MQQVRPCTPEGRLAISHRSSCQLRPLNPIFQPHTSLSAAQLHKHACNVRFVQMGSSGTTVQTPTTLAQLISPHRVPKEEVEEEFGANFRLLEVIIGGVPNSCFYSAIWHPGSCTFHLLPPNFLNLPQLLTEFAAPKELVGLAMVASARAASCPYCTAHCCSFAQRRGAGPTLSAGHAGERPVEQAVEQFTTALASVPHTFTPEMHQELRKHLSEEDTEWIAMSVCMMGWLTKFMDGMGIELEAQAVNDVGKVLGPSEWQPGQHAWPFAAGELKPDRDAAPPSVDGVKEALKVMQNAPGALRTEAKMLAGVPKDGPGAREMIAGYGFDEPLLEELSFARVKNALAGVMKYNFAPENSVIGIPTKALAGIVFAKCLGNTELAERCNELASYHNVSPDVIQLAEIFDGVPTSNIPNGDEKLQAALMMADNMGPSPAQVSSSTIERAAVLLPEEVIEVTTFLSVLQLLHRLAVWKSCASAE